MRFSLSAATAALVMATSAFAQEGQVTSDFDPVTSPSANQTIPTGQSFPITWTPISKYDAVQVKIELVGGHYQNGQTHRAWVTRESTPAQAADPSLVSNLPRSRGHDHSQQGWHLHLDRWL